MHLNIKLLISVRYQQYLTVIGHISAFMTDISKLLRSMITDIPPPHRFIAAELQKAPFPLFKRHNRPYYRVYHNTAKKSMILPQIFLVFLYNIDNFTQLADFILTLAIYCGIVLENSKYFYENNVKTICKNDEDKNEGPSQPAVRPPF